MTTYEKPKEFPRMKPLAACIRDALRAYVAGWLLIFARICVFYSLDYIFLIGDCSYSASKQLLPSSHSLRAWVACAIPSSSHPIEDWALVCSIAAPSSGKCGRSRGKTWNQPAAIQKWPSFIWGFPVTKTMPMVKLCVEWLRKLLAFLDRQVNILSTFGLSNFSFCL